MHGMVNRALQGFVIANYGPAIWAEIRGIARLPEEGFEAMHRYDHALTVTVFGAAVDVLEKHPNTLLEDIGTYLVTHPQLQPLRRLLRFGGETFEAFLLSLEELPDRGRLALPDLEMPDITLTAEAEGAFLITARWPVPGIAPLLMGALRAMADDYGTLVLMELAGIADGAERLRVRVVDVAFNEGKAFSLGEVAP